MANDISIIIPVFNREHIVLRTLQSVAAQTYRPLTVILVDNNSTDNTLDVLNHWCTEMATPDFQIKVISETTPGASVARNAGLKHVTTKWTMFFDSDDIMLPTHIEQALRCADENADAEVIGWDRAINHSDGHRVIRRFNSHDFNFNNVFHSIMSTLTYMARTEIFRKAGGWNDKISMGDDIELGQRILCLKPKIYKVGGPITVEIYESEESITANSSKKIAGFVDAYESIRSNLPKKQRHWVDLRYIVLATNESKHDPNAHEFISSVLNRTDRKRRWLFKLLYQYSLHGGRGVAFIYKSLFKL